MSKLSPIPARVLIEMLLKMGYVVRRQRGSHITFIRKQPAGRVTVPNHKEIKVGTLRQILRDLDLTVEQFNDLLKK